MKYDRERWHTAHEKYLDDPKTLTDADLEMLAVVDPEFSERARAKRAGFVEEETANRKEINDRHLTYHAFFKWLDDHVMPVVGTYKHRLAALEERLAAVEAAKSAGVHWQGVFAEGKSYPEGGLVTRGGSLWLCIQHGTTSIPGRNPDAWRLVTKGGRE